MNTNNDAQNHYPLSERNAEIEKLIMVYKTGILPEWKNLSELFNEEHAALLEPFRQRYQEACNEWKQLRNTHLLAASINHLPPNAVDARKNALTVIENVRRSTSRQVHGILQTDYGIKLPDPKALLYSSSDELDPERVQKIWKQLKI
jgi:hypothetical protein